MLSRRAKRAFAVAVIATGAVFVAAGPASAHVGVTPDHLSAGATTVLTFSFSHGCNGSPTTAITFNLPTEIPTAKATLLAGWQITSQTEKLATPIQSGDTTITERVKSITYTSTSGPVPNDVRAAFELSLSPIAAAAGKTLYVPTVQTCVQGATSWVEIPAPGQSEEDLADPAPAVEVGAAATGAHDDDDEAVDADLATSSSDESDSSDTLAIVAIVVGGLGVILGGLGFVTARRAGRT